MTKQKSYCFNVTVKWAQISDGNSKRQAIENLKQSFIDEFNIELEDNEIEEVKA